MPPQPPFLLADNVFDRINLYPSTALGSYPGDRPGTDVRFVADYRRERTLWQASASVVGAYVRSDLGVGITASVDTLVIDRGHNLWGRSINVLYSMDPTLAVYSTYNFTAPAQGTVGGDPTSAVLAATEEGALYGFLPATPASRMFVVQVNENWQMLLTGVILGKRVQLTGYATKLDEDAGQRSQRSEESAAGYTAADRTYAWRTLELPLAQIGAATYDAQIRLLRRLCFERNQPTFIAMNYGTYAERAWLYRFDGTSWSSPLTRVQRSVTLPFRELYPLIA